MAAAPVEGFINLVESKVWLYARGHRSSIHAMTVRKKIEELGKENRHMQTACSATKIYEHDEVL